MRTRTTIACLLIVALATSIGGAIHQNHRLQNPRKALIASQRQGERQVRELKLAKVRETEEARIAREAEGECVTLQKRIEAMANKVPPTTGRTASQPLTVQDYNEQLLNLSATNPEYQKLTLELNRAGFGARYARFYKDQGLTPEQIARFEDLLVARVQAYYDLMAAAQTQGIKRTDPAFYKLEDPAQQELKAKFIELLGEKGYAESGKSGSTTLALYATRDLTTALFYSAAPLTISQADTLEEIIKRNTSGHRSATRVDWNTVYTQVENVLTPYQLAELKSQRETERLNREMQELVDKAATARK